MLILNFIQKSAIKNILKSTKTNTSKTAIFVGLFFETVNTFPLLRWQTVNTFPVLRWQH